MATVASVAVLGVGWQLGVQAVDAGQNLASATAATAATAASAAATDATVGSGTTGTSGTSASAAATDATVPARPSAPAAAAASATPSETAPAAATQPAAVPAAVSATSTGTTAQTRFGPVQVSVTISNGTITEVTALQLTNHDGRSVMISNRAAPVLRSEVLQAQSASVQNVSGATYTSQGYAQSLQSALDAAGF